MANPIQKSDENIIIRTMRGDLEDLNNPHPKKEERLTAAMPAGPISQEARALTPLPPPAPTLMPMTPASPLAGARAESRPPILVIPPKKTIPPKEIAEMPTKPLFKATPVWLKIGGLGLGALLLVLLGLYGYWKIFIRSQPPAPTPKVATTTPPAFPITGAATTTVPIKFFNKLPNKEVAIDIYSKTPAVLIKSLKSEAAVKEALASVKQVKITYQGKPITAGEFLNLISIFAPKDFLSNYEDEFAFAFFSQKEGARPILILKTKNRSLAENQIKDWEASTLPSDIFPLFLTDFKLPNYLPAFKSYLFIGQPVRYLNINLSFASLNYAVYNDFLIFTTSSAGMFVVLQDLTGRTVSLDYIKSLEASINSFVK